MWTLAGIALASAVAGCVLFVDPPQGGAGCSFAGRGSPCGDCLRTRCASAVDAVCLDDAVMATVGECAERGTEACDRVPAGSLASCLHDACGALCYARTGASLTACKESFLAPRLACTCTAGNGANDLDCSVAKFPGSVCCAPSGWPGPAAQCSCRAVSCGPSTSGCACTLSDNVAGDTPTTCSGTICCAAEERCQCGVRPCGASERRVERCDGSVLGCGAGTTAVSSCAVRQ